jgi:hypothetical protein
MKNTREFKSVGEIIPNAFKKIGADGAFLKYSVIANWEKITSKEVAENSFVSNIDRNILIVKTKNSVWSHHLMMLKEEIIKKVNDYSGKNLVTDIRFMAGYNKNSQNYNKDDETDDNSAKNKPIPILLDKSELVVAQVIAEKANDEEIRQKIGSLIIKNIALEKAKKAENWKPCLKCEVLTPPEEKYCTVCRINKIKIGTGKSKIIAAQKMLNKFPWQSYEEIKKNLDLSPDEYDVAKKNLIRHYMGLVFRENGDRACQAVLAMLLKGAKSETLTEECIDDVIDKVKKALLKAGRRNHVFTSRS